jgi:hypothetical protein
MRAPSQVYTPLPKRVHPSWACAPLPPGMCAPSLAVRAPTEVFAPPRKHLPHRPSTCARPPFHPFMPLFHPYAPLFHPFAPLFHLYAPLFHPCVPLFHLCAPLFHPCTPLFHPCVPHSPAVCPPMATVRALHRAMCFAARAI